jgi:gliding motility-associated-like protein
VRGTGITELQLLIFDRWGELIFTSEQLANGWDGTYAGRVVEDGVYEYKVHYRVVDAPGWHQAVGHVTVLR